MKRAAFAVAVLFVALSSSAQTVLLREVANGLNMPVGIAHAKDSRLFIVTQPGAIFVTGDLWIADVGQDVWEEIDVQPATSRGGENYGWEDLEGTGCNAGDCNPTGTIKPVLTYGHDEGACAITGGYRYRGSAIPELAGLYIYADFCTGTISAAQPFDESEWLPRQLFNARFLVSSFGEDCNSELYVIDYGGGSVYKLEDARGLRLRVAAPRR